MTVSTTTTKNSYSGNGTLHSFAYGFKIFADADLSVVVRNAAGAETTKTLNTHYIVTNAGTDTGGNVLFKFNTGTSSDAHHSTSDFRPASGETVVISRALTLTQGTDYVANDPFPANSHENALDRLTMIQQQQQEELDRTIKASVTNTISGAEFTTSASDRANKVMSFDGSGNLTVTTGKVDTVSVSVSGLTTGASATASATFTASSGALALALGIPAGATGATGPAGGGLAQLVADTSPELGGDLDVLARDIVSSSNRTIDLAPHGTGKVVVRGNTNPGTIIFNCESNSHGQTVKAQPHSASVTNTLTLPAGGDQTLVGTAGATFTGDVTVPDGDLILGSTAVTSTSAEINQLDAITRGSILYGNASGATARLAKGSANTVLTSDGTDIAWQAAAGGGAMEFIVSTGAISNAANVSFTQFDSSKYDAYAFYYYYVIPATDNVYFVWNSSTDGGSSYAESNGDYRYGQSGAGNGVGYGYVNASYQVGSDTNEFGITGAINLMQPHNTTTYKIFQSSSGPTYSKTNGYMATDTNDYGNSYRFSTADIDAIRFKFTSGNIESGEIVMYGIKNA